MQLSMDAFLTPIETPNQAMQRTASRTALHFMRVCHLPGGWKRRVTALAVAGSCVSLDLPHDSHADISSSVNRAVLPLVSRLIGATHRASHSLASRFARPHIFLAVGLAVGIANFAVLVGLWRFQSWARIGNIIVLLIVLGFTFSALNVGFVGRGFFGMMYLVPFVQGALFAMMFLPPVSLEFERQKV